MPATFADPLGIDSPKDDPLGIETQRDDPLGIDVPKETPPTIIGGFEPFPKVQPARKVHIPTIGEQLAPVTDFVNKELAPVTKPLAQTLSWAGNVARAIPADVATAWSPGEADEFGGNLATALNQPLVGRAARRNRPPEFEVLPDGTAVMRNRADLPEQKPERALPIDAAIDAAGKESGLRGEFPWAQLSANVSQGVAKTAPKLALLPLAGPTLPAQMAAGGALFGMDDEGRIDPKQAATMALLPGVGAAVKRATAAAIGQAIARGATALENPAAQKVLEEIGHQSGLNAYMVAADSPELAKLSRENPEEFKRQLAEIVATNLGFGLLGVKDWRRAPSQTQQFIDRNAQLFTQDTLKRIATRELRNVLEGKPSTADNLPPELPQSAQEFLQQEITQPGKIDLQPAANPYLESAEAQPAETTSLPKTASESAPTAAPVAGADASGTLAAIAAQKPETAQRTARIEASKEYTVEQALKDLPGVMLELKAALEKNQIAPQPAESAAPKQPLESAPEKAPETADVRNLPAARLPIVDEHTGEVVLSDGKRFGRQELRPGERIWVENPDPEISERIAENPQGNIGEEQARYVDKSANGAVASAYGVAPEKIAQVVREGPRTPYQPELPLQPDKTSAAGSAGRPSVDAPPGRPFDSLRTLKAAHFRRDFEGKSKVSSIDQTKAEQGVPVFQIKGTQINHPGDFARTLVGLRSPNVESLKVAILDRDNRVVHSQVMYAGTLDSAVLDARDFIRLHALYGKEGGRLLISHNHPSGDPTPSDADRKFTRQLQRLAEAAGFNVTDHVITNGETYYSMRLDSRLAYDKPVLAQWENLRRSELRELSSTSDFSDLVYELRQANPNVAHIIYLGTRLRVTAVERVAPEQQAIWDAMAKGIGVEAARHVLVDFGPTVDRADAYDWTNRYNRALVGTTTRVADFASKGTISGRSEGLVEPYMQDAPNVATRVAENPSFSAVGKGFVPPRFQLRKPIVGPTGAKIVGYEWRSRMGEKWSSARQEYVKGRVSDWDNSDTSTGTGRDIVHVFFVEHPDGKVKPEGIRSAQNVLGISETRLQTIAKNERAAQQYRAEQYRLEVEGYAKAAKATAAEAARDYRVRNHTPMRSAEENDGFFQQSLLFEKDGKFVRRNGRESIVEQMQRHGWSVVKDDPANTEASRAFASRTEPVRESPTQSKPAGELTQETLFSGIQSPEPPALREESPQGWQSLKTARDAAEEKLRVAVRNATNPDARRAAELSVQQARNQRDVATAEFRRAEEALRSSPDYVRHLSQRAAELARSLKAETDPQRKAELESEFESVKHELEQVPAKMLDFIQREKFLSGERRSVSEEQAGAEHPGTERQSESQRHESKAEIAPETRAEKFKANLAELPAKVSDAFAAAGKLRQRLGNLWTARHERDVIAATFDAAENGGNLFGKQAGNEILHELNRSFGASGDRVSARNPLRENALSFVIESGGDQGALAEMREKILGSEFRNKRAAREALAAIKFAETHWDRLQPIAELYAKITDAQVEHERLAGVETLHRDGGYVMHLEDVMASQPILDIGGNGGFGPGSPFLKIRTHATFADAIAAGATPKSMNAVDLMQRRLATGQKLINHGAWVDGLRRVIDPGTQQPLVSELQTHVRADGKEYDAAPPGYAMIDYAGQRFAILKGGYDKLVQALVTPSTIRNSVAGNVAMELAGGIKHGMLVFDTYHLGRIAFWNAMVRGGLLPGNPAAYKRGLLLLDQTVPEIRRMVQNGEVPAKLGADLIESKRQLGVLVANGLNVGGAADNIATHFVQHLPIAGRFNRFLFQEFQRGATAEAALIELRRQLKMNPGADESMIARKVARDLNVRFGNLQNQSWIKNKNVAELLRMIFLAPQWNESLIRSELGAAKELLQAVPASYRTRRLNVGLLGRAVFTAAVGQFLANQVINYITRGQPTWDNPEESETAKISAWIPDVVGDGPGFFLNPLTLPAEVSELLMKKTERSGDFTQALKQYFASRLGPLGRIPYTLAVREDATGAKLKTGGEVAGQMASSLVPVPLPASSIYRGAKQLVTGEQEQKFPGQFQRQIAQTFGVKLDSAPTDDQRIRALATEFNREKGITPSAEFFHGDYYDLDRALQVNNQREIKRALEELLQKKTADDVRKHYERWATARFTGKKDREADFVRTLNAEQRSAYDRAQRKREQLRDRVKSLLAGG